MTQEVDIVDRVNVAIVDGIEDAGSRAAIPVSTPLVVLIGNKSTGQLRRVAVHGFTGDGEPLVLDGTRLVRAAAVVKSGEKLHSICPKEPTKLESPVGPFTPAPSGMSAVLNDGSTLPVAYYDVHGRACAVDQDPVSRSLFVLEEQEDVVRIDVPPVAQ